jgi:hypothetical protein
MSLSDVPEYDPDAGPDADTDADADTDTDVVPDGGPGKKSDSGCGCRVSGGIERPVSLVDVVLSSL